MNDDEKINKVELSNGVSFKIDPEKIDGIRKHMRNDLGFDPYSAYTQGYVPRGTTTDAATYDYKDRKIDRLEYRVIELEKIVSELRKALSFFNAFLPEEG